MSYKSLLFCPDEKTARVVTQVLSELEFTVELSGEPFATVKKLTDEHFDALVVDCQNEQDASLIFKAARNSSLNHSSLSVAVVEGQAGVAKAFRIGANLVLSKPVNVEQSKSTLRVARGLLRKNSEARAASSGGTLGEASAAAVNPASVPLVSPSMSPSASPLASPAMLPSRPFAFEPAASSAIGPGTMRSVPEPAEPSAPSTPYSALELEKDPTPEAEPSDAALLESMPDPLRGKPAPVAEPMWAPRSQGQGQGQAQPIAANTGGQGTATAPARAAEVRLTGLSPLVTNDPIVADSGATEHFPVDSIPVPTFATLDSRRPVSSSGSSGGKRWGKTIVALLILGVAGYLAWHNIQPLQYLPGSPSLEKVVKQAAAPAATPAPASSASSAAASTSSTGDAGSSSPDTTSSDATPAASDSATVTSSSPAAPAVAASGAPARTSPDNIRVQEMPMNLDQKTRLAAKPQSNLTQSTPAQPIVVRPGTTQTKPGSQAAKPQPSQPTPPALTLSSANNSTAALASIVSTQAAKPALGSFRISQGVSQGMIVKKVAPVYSATALQLHKEGTVELMATISKDGSVTSVQVLKGDLLLSKSAVDAVKQWKYRPYLLNGEPVEIQTQITVNFKMPQ